MVIAKSSRDALSDLLANLVLDARARNSRSRLEENRVEVVLRVGRDIADVERVRRPFGALRSLWCPRKLAHQLADANAALLGLDALMLVMLITSCTRRCGRGPSRSR
jgi:hypothetical protein